MASVAVKELAEAEATPLIGVVPAQDAKAPGAAASVETRRQRLSPTWKEDAVGPPPPPAKQSMASLFSRVVRLHKMDREVTMDCLHCYNLKHPGNEYEPAPGKVDLMAHFYNGICWTHWNFVARKKRYGWLSFLPTPRTLFFYELVHTRDFDGIVTCTPLDEPVTESYSVLGFPLGFSARRSGKFDSFCKTCYNRFDVPHPGIQKTFACEHKHVEKVCEMCYLRSHVLHPHPGGFAFVYHDPYPPLPN